MKNGLRAFALTLSLGSFVAATADTVVGANGAWQNNWSQSTLVANSASPNGGTPYWNNASGDGPKDNVGWCLTGGGSCTMSGSPNAALPYFGNGSSSVGTMYFASNGSSLTVSLLDVLTTQTTTAGGYDVFGYYLANTGGTASGTNLVPLFDSRTSILGATSNINSIANGQNYGFYIENIQGGGTVYESDYFYFMDSSADYATGAMPADNLQHFAVFQGANSYFIGDADGDNCQNGFQPGTSPCVPSSQFDFNNLLVQVSSTALATPEPASLGLAGGALVFLTLLPRRKKAGLSEN